MAIIVDEASEDQTPSSSSSARNDEVVGVAKDSARRRTHNKARGRTSTLDTNSPSPMLLLLQQTRDRHRHHHHHHNNATSLRTFSGKRHVRTLVNPNSSPSRASGSSINGGAVLRYRTDLDKEVIHFMFERHAAAHASHRVEELVVDGTAERDGAATGEWNFFWMSVGRLRTLMANADYRLGEYQIINHFPHHYELTRKDLMYKNIKRYLRECQQQRRSLTLITAREWATASALASMMQSGGAASPTDDVMDRPHVRFGNDDVDEDGSATPRDGNSRDALRGDGYQRFSFADAVPTTFNIPNDMGMFMEEFKRRPGATWIVKPTSRSQGKGIFLINKLPQLLRWVKEKKEVESMTYNGTLHLPTTGATSGAAATTTSSSSANASSGAPLSSAAAHNMLGLFIVSRYITNPLLIGGKKFDLRLYCLVTSYKPLVAYLHRDGFARFCATKYAGNHCLSEEDLGSHLTNVALQKGDAHYNDLHGGKWSLQNLFLYVQARYGPYAAESMMMKIEFLLFHSLRAMEPVIFNDRHACELYGFDVLIGDQLEPYLIEVNASPSLSTTTTSDRLMKEQVLSDMLKIVLPPGFPNAKSMPYGDYRLRVDLTTQLNTGFKLLHFPSK